jgi:hypothetical protein
MIANMINVMSEKNLKVDNRTKNLLKIKLFSILF